MKKPAANKPVNIEQLKQRYGQLPIQSPAETVKRVLNSGKSPQQNKSKK